MSKTVVVGCKLPNGLVIEVGNKQVKLNGVNQSMIIGATYATTDVDAEFWNAWSTASKDFPALANGSIFVAKSFVEIEAVAKDAVKVKTGMERIKTDGSDSRAGSTTPLGKEKV